MVDIIGVGDRVPGHHAFFGKYKGFVRDNNDPEKRGRIRCYCPQIMGTVDSPATWLGWAEPCLPWLGGVSTGDLGAPFTREEQRQSAGVEYMGVWLEFEAGNPDFPLWSGVFAIAPVPTSPGAHRHGAGVTGGGILGGPLPLPDGSDVSALTPPAPAVGMETRLVSQAGRDIVIGVEGGGFIILGPGGVHISGVQITLNGRQVLASSVKIGM